MGPIQIIVLPKKELFVGEVVPVDVKVFLGARAQIQNPQITGDGLLLADLNKPEESTQVVGGREYDVLTWHSAITAMKTGDYAISLRARGVAVVVPQMQQMDSDDFNSFFRNAFAAMGQRKEITLTNAPDSVKVLPLPQANRPADFSGAVGQFEIEANATPSQVNAGDPITLRLRVTGKGNFDRVSSNGLPADANWKTYSPKSSFEPADSVGYEGTKTFEQPIIPQDPSITSVPPVSFSFFNPETRQYVTSTASPIAISVIG